MKYYTEDIGVCPKCESEDVSDVDYGDYGFDGETFFFYTSCSHCGFRYKEYYYIEYAEGFENEHG